MNRNTRIALGAGVLALLAGAVGPWATVLGAINIGPTNSAEVSAVVFGGALILVLSAAFGRAMRTASIVVGVAAVAEVVYAFVRIEQVKNDAGDWGALVSPGWGLYLSGLAGLYLIASTWIVKRQGVAIEREPTERELGSTPPPVPAES